MLSQDLPTSLDIYTFYESLQCPVMKKNFITSIAIRSNLNHNLIENCFQKLDFPAHVRVSADMVMKEYKLKLAEKV